jgi:hypothetical protein
VNKNLGYTFLNEVIFMSHLKSHSTQLQTLRRSNFHALSPKKHNRIYNHHHHGMRLIKRKHSAKKIIPREQFNESLKGLLELEKQRETMRKQITYLFINCQQISTAFINTQNTNSNESDFISYLQVASITITRFLKQLSFSSFTSLYGTELLRELKEKMDTIVTTYYQNQAPASSVSGFDGFFCGDATVNKSTSINLQQIAEMLAVVEQFLEELHDNLSSVMMHYQPPSPIRSIPNHHAAAAPQNSLPSYYFAQGSNFAAAGGAPAPEQSQFTELTRQPANYSLQGPCTMYGAPSSFAPPNPDNAPAAATPKS